MKQPLALAASAWTQPKHQWQPEEAKCVAPWLPFASNMETVKIGPRVRAERAGWVRGAVVLDRRHMYCLSVRAMLQCRLRHASPGTVVVGYHMPYAWTSRARNPTPYHVRT
eukprot:scaffold123074_cov37-Tisochrysis_lutea.AAC.3